MIIIQVEPHIPIYKHVNYKKQIRQEYVKYTQVFNYQIYNKKYIPDLKLIFKSKNKKCSLIPNNKKRK